jgi:AcrR family transcriptional regulator
MLTQDPLQSPAERRHSKTRQQILAAAHSILRAKGIEGLTMRSLAEKMDYTPAALYKYFSDKEDILEGLRQEGWALLRARNAEATREHVTPLELFKALGRAYQDFAGEYPEYYLLMFTSARTAPHCLDEITSSPDFKRMTDLVQAAVDDGHIQLPSGTTALDIRFLIWFLSHGMAMLRLTLLRECQPEFQAASEKAIDAFVRMLAMDSRLGDSL